MDPPTAPAGTASRKSAAADSICVYQANDTIAAVASAPGGAARAIVRISGPRVADVLSPVFRAEDPASLATATGPRRWAGVLVGPTAQHAELVLPGHLYFWPGTRSYTRQPLAEWHMLGSPPLVAAALCAVCAAGARQAQPGEFTLRAFLAGRLDLTQAEAVLGVIDANGPRDLQLALAQLAGGLAAPLHGLRSQLLDLLAHLEAGLDFVEEDIEFISAESLRAQLQSAAEQVDLLLSRLDQRMSAGEAPRVVLVGRPNVGKSSLFNALCGGPAALVADLPGTTRDFVRGMIDLGGVRCELIDTAGVDDTAGGVTRFPPRRSGRRGTSGSGPTCCWFAATRPGRSTPGNKSNCKRSPKVMPPECSRSCCGQSAIACPATIVRQCGDPCRCCRLCQK